MGVVLELLVPGVKHTEEADIGAEMFGITSDFQQGLGAGAEQETIERLLILQRQRGKQMRQREDNVDVGRGQQLLVAVREPTRTCVALALWAMPVPARVVGDDAMPAAGAFVDVAPERSRAATLDGSHYFLMAARQPPLVTFGEIWPRSADQIGHL